MKASTAEQTAGSKSRGKVQKFCEHCGVELEQLFFEGNGIKIHVPAYKKCTCPDAIVEQEKAEELKRLQLEQERQQQELERQQRIAEEEKRKINELFGNSGMSKRAMNCLFKNYQQNENNAQAYKTCGLYAKEFETVSKTSRNGLFITGVCGVGKSHLAFSIANYLIKRGHSVIAMTMIDLLLKIKSSFNGGKQTEEEILKIYDDCDLLIIDDLGKEKPTEWALQMIYSIIDRRYNSLKPIVITTNFNAEELIKRLGDTSIAHAIVDRLFEICEYVSIEGESFRRR